MFIGLKAPFVEGEMVKATLTFEKAGQADAMFKVGPLGGMAGHGAMKPGQTNHSGHKSN
jgi:periplasmic copper chaperone A